MKNRLKRTPKVKPLTLSEQVAAAQAKVAQSIDVFKTAENEVSIAQEELAGIIAEAQEEVNKFTKIKEDAQAELDYNAKVKTKLAEFTN